MVNAATRLQDLGDLDSPYALLVAWDTHGRTTDFSVSGPGGSYEGTSFTDKSWGATQVWLALVASVGADDGHIGLLGQPVRCKLKTEEK